MITPQQYFWMLQQANNHPPPGSTPAPYEKIYDDSGRRMTSSQTSPSGQGPTATPNSSGIDFPPAEGGNPPTTAPYDPRFETPNNPNQGWGLPSTSEGMLPFDPQLYYPSDAGANVPTNEGQIPHDEEQYRNPIGLAKLPDGYQFQGTPGEMYGNTQNIPTMEDYTYTQYTPQDEMLQDPQLYYPSESLNIPTNEGMLPSDTQQYNSGGPENIPTNEGMMPTGSNDFLPSEGANIPTNEGMLPHDEQQYMDSTAGANIPTDENMMADLAPDAFGQSELPAEAAPEGQSDSFYYPTGDGGYQELDSSGNPVTSTGGGTPASAPGQPVFPINWASGAPGGGGVQGPLYANAPAGTTAAGGTSFGSDLSQDIGDVGNFIKGIPGAAKKALSPDVGYYSPEYLASQGYEPGQGTNSQWPGEGPSTTSYDVGAYGAGGGGGSFFHGNVGAGPIAGSFTNLGGSANAATEQVPFWQRMLMRQARATTRKGYKSPLIGTGDAVAKFASRLGSHARFQGAYSPAAAAAAMGYPAMVGGGQQGGGGDNDNRGARGPGGRSMSPV